MRHPMNWSNQCCALSKWCIPRKRTPENPIDLGLPLVLVIISCGSNDLSVEGICVSKGAGDRIRTGNVRGRTSAYKAAASTNSAMRAQGHSGILSDKNTGVNSFVTFVYNVKSCIGKHQIPPTRLGDPVGGCSQMGIELLRCPVLWQSGQCPLQTQASRIIGPR